MRIEVRSANEVESMQTARHANALFPHLAATPEAVRAADQHVRDLSRFRASEFEGAAAGSRLPADGY